MSNEPKFQVGDAVRDTRYPDSGTYYVASVYTLGPIEEDQWTYGLSPKPGENLAYIAGESVLEAAEKTGGRELIYNYESRETRGEQQEGMTCLVLNIEEKITVGAHMTREEEEAVTAIFQEGSEACSSLLYEIKRKAVEYLEENAQ